jgi:hypothetical protein
LPTDRGGHGTITALLLMKTSYELAMERLGKMAPTVKLTEGQRQQLAELDSLYKAKLAERELFLQGEMEKAAAKEGYAALEPLQKQLASDRKSLQAELEEKKEKVRQQAGTGK